MSKILFYRELEGTVLEECKIEKDENKIATENLYLEVYSKLKSNSVVYQKQQTLETYGTAY